jgi:hypothetical protein
MTAMTTFKQTEANRRNATSTGPVSEDLRRSIGGGAGTGAAVIEPALAGAALVQGLLVCKRTPISPASSSVK